MASNTGAFAKFWSLFDAARPALENCHENDLPVLLKTNHKELVELAAKFFGFRRPAKKRKLVEEPESTSPKEAKDSVWTEDKLKAWVREHFIRGSPTQPALNEENEQKDEGLEKIKDPELRRLAKLHKWFDGNQARLLHRRCLLASCVSNYYYKYQMERSKLGAGNKKLRRDKESIKEVKKAPVKTGYRVLEEVGISKAQTIRYNAKSKIFPLSEYNWEEEKKEFLWGKKR